MSGADCGLGGLEAQQATKDRDRQELLAARVHQLECLLKQAQQECSSLRKCYYQLREDFLFNLDILDEQGRELQRLDTIAARALTVENNSFLAGKTQNQMEAYENMRSDLQGRIQELEGELTLQRQEMTAAFDRELRQQKHTFNLQMDKMQASVLSHDLKVMLLSKESEVHSQAQLQASEALRASEQFHQQIQTQLQQKHDEVKHLTAVKDHRIKGLKDELKLMEIKLKNEEDNNMKKYKDMVRAVKECEVQLELQCRAHSEQLQKAEDRFDKLQEKIQVLAAQARCIQEKQQAAMKQRDKTIQRYKEQLSAGLERERALEQTRVQVELEWQRHCEDTKAECYLANEQLIQDLTQARDQAKAELKEKERELQDMTVLIRSTNRDRDQPVQVDVPKGDSSASEEIHRLQRQNSILRAVVAQMRKDMEALNRRLPHLQAKPHSCLPQSVQHPPTPAASSSTPTDCGQQAQSNDNSSRISPGGPSSYSSSSPKRAHLLEERPGQEQQASGLVSGGMSEDIQGATSNPPLLHTRLKQAACCIARLSREKQQLIEMGNCLRAQIITSPGPKEAVEPERESSKETHTESPDQSTVEQLQYLLTAQWQDALMQRTSRPLSEQLLPGSHNPGPIGKRAANPWSQEAKPTDSPESLKNKENSPLIRQSNVELVRHMGLSSSILSLEESLQPLNELWEILDHGLSPSILIEAEGELSRAEAADVGVQTMVHSVNAPIHNQPPNEVWPKRNPSTTPSNTPKTSRRGARDRISKIRNYNVKD